MVPRASVTRQRQAGVNFNTTQNEKVRHHSRRARRHHHCGFCGLKMHKLQRDRVERAFPLRPLQGNRGISASPVIGEGSAGCRAVEMSGSAIPARHLPKFSFPSASTATPRESTSFLNHHVSLPAAFEEVFPGTLQNALDPCQRGQRREILPGLKALPIPGAEPRFLRHLLLRDPGPDPHRSHVFTKTIAAAAGGRFFRWHARHRCENEKPATRGFTSLCVRV